MKTPKLTPKQKLFCNHWLKHRNATRAYKETYGGTYDTARVEGAKNLTKPSCRAYLDPILESIDKRFEMDLENCLKGLFRIANSNMMDYADLVKGEIDLSEVDYDQAAAIQELSTEEYFDEDGRSRKKTKIKLYDKKGALKDIGVHFGGFKNTHKHEGKVTLEQLLTKSIGDGDE